MNENLIYLLCESFAPLLMLGIGFYLWKKPPKPNDIVGYRTKRSRSSEAAWYTGQLIFGKYMIQTFATFSAVTLLFGMFALVRNLSETAAFTACMILTGTEIAAAVAVIFATERKLRRMFDKNGEPRE